MVTFERVCELLDEIGLQYHRDDTDEVAIALYSGAQVFIKVAEEGEAVLAFSPFLLSIYEGPRRYRRALLRQIAGLNYLIKVGKLCVDPRDGDVSATHLLIVEDGELTERQLERAVSAVCRIAQCDGELLRRVAYRGDGGQDAWELVEAHSRRRAKRRAKLGLQHDPDAEPEDCPPDLRELLAMFDEEDTYAADESDDLEDLGETADGDAPEASDALDEDPFSDGPATGDSATPGEVDEVGELSESEPPDEGDEDGRAA